MEEEGEPVEEEVGEEEFRETPARKRSGRRILVLVVVIIAVLAFTGVYFLFLRNAPPNAEFTYNSVDKHLSVNAENTTDPDDSIASYSWNWGDGSPVDSGNLVTATHDFPQERIPYTVTLTVRDSRGASGTATHSITLVILPTPLFIARQAGMTTSFDAGQSTASPGKTIASYRWNFGDGGTNTSRVTTHTYANPGRYVVSLNVTQPDGLSNTVARYVSANTTTVDILANQFFVSGCPYNNYWDLRYRTYGDQILRRPSPCTDFYPWILYKGHPDTNPSFVYTLYRFDARVTNNLGYSVWQPVMLPVFNASVVASPSSYIHLNFTFNYLNNTDIAYWDNTSWPVNSKYSDGFGYLVRGTVQMDLQESKRIFDVGDPVPFSPTANFTSQWKNSNNGLSSDNRYTTTSMNGAITEYGNYSVPQLASSPIQEVEVGLEAHSAGDDQVRVDFSTDGGLTWATAGTVTPGATDGTTFIDVTSLRTWTVPLLSDTNFRTRIAYVQVGPTNSTVFVDWVPIRVQSISPAWWWSASTELGGSNVGPLENAVGVWLDQQGNGKYDIWNGFQWYYESDIADLNAAVAPDGTTTVTIFLDGWGLDTLMARWFYWGSASYHDAVCVVGYGTCTQTLPYGANGRRKHYPEPEPGLPGHERVLDGGCRQPRSGRILQHDDFSINGRSRRLGFLPEPHGLRAAVRIRAHGRIVLPEFRTAMVRTVDGTCDDPGQLRVRPTVRVHGRAKPMEYEPREHADLSAATLPGPVVRPPRLVLGLGGPYRTVYDLHVDHDSPRGDADRAGPGLLPVGWSREGPFSGGSFRVRLAECEQPSPRPRTIHRIWARVDRMMSDRRFLLARCRRIPVGGVGQAISLDRSRISMQSVKRNAAALRGGRFKACRAVGKKLLSKAVTARPRPRSSRTRGR